MAKLTCKKVCHEWHEVKGVIKTYTNCKWFTIHNSKPACLKYGKLKSVIAGQVFYLGRRK